jgi:hypothetical protein
MGCALGAPLDGGGVVLSADIARTVGVAVRGAPRKKLDAQVESADIQLVAMPAVEGGPASGRASAAGRATRAKAATTIMAETRRTRPRDIGIPPHSVRDHQKRDPQVKNFRALARTSVHECDSPPNPGQLFSASFESR